jgi:putative aldouronate transport system permease protein
MRLTKADYAYQTSAFIIVSLLLLSALFPLVYVAGQSFTSESEWISSYGRVIIPQRPTLESYNLIFKQWQVYLRAFSISIARTLIGTALNIFFSMCLGYVLSRKDMPLKQFLLFMTLITILFGGGLIPSFLVVNALGMYNSFWSMVIPGLVSGWSALIFRQFFLNTPESIEESARMDGASETTIMWRIIVPLSKAVIAALTLFAAVGHWNSWFDAMVYIRSQELRPFQLLLRNLFNSSVRSGVGIDDLVSRLQTAPTPNGIKMAVTVVGVLPILCVYPFLQKYFTKGVYMGAVKE